MTTPNPQSPVPNPQQATYAWPLLLCLVGVDYFSTLAYLPSIAVSAAGPLAPVAAAGVVLATFLLALPVYWYVVSRSTDGRGAAGLLEDSIPGWRGKLIVLTLLGFAAVDFVITRSLSLADAAIHLIHNPHGQQWLKQLPVDSLCDQLGLWSPLDALLRRLADPQVAVTLGLSIASMILWQLLRRGVSRASLLVATGAVLTYLALTAVVIVSGIAWLANHPAVWSRWVELALFSPRAADTPLPSNYDYLWALGGVALWSFPQLALGLSGFEMIMTVAPQVAGHTSQTANDPKRRIRNMRKLMVAAATIMAIYLVSAVVVTTLLVPHKALTPGGPAEHRALAYIAHGSPLAEGAEHFELNPLFGDAFGLLFDASTVLILCLAGVSVTMGVQKLLPHYLNRLGMDVSWAGRIGVIACVLYAIVVLVTVVFRASPSAQQWAYATSVLVLLAGAAAAALVDLSRRARRGPKRLLFVALAALAGGFFATMAGLTVLINQSGLTIAAAFVSAILLCSFISRWIRSTELRFEGFEFADPHTQHRWEQLRRRGAQILVPHRPGLIPLEEKSAAVRREYRLAPDAAILFVEAELGDPSNFYQQPLMSIEREGELEVIRVSRCVSVAHVLAAIGLQLCGEGVKPPEIVFGWSAETPIAANLNFLLLGEGNIPWMVKELVSKSIHAPANQPRIVIG